MTWTKPDFLEISLCMEVTAYVNTDDQAVAGGQWTAAREPNAPAVSLTTDHGPLATA
jgi:coenzyme PQQ precursor peptide PqqA